MNGPPVYHPPLHMTAAPTYHAPPPPAAAPRTDSDVQWIVGWIRDLLVIAMSLANLAHLGSH